VNRRLSLAAWLLLTGILAFGQAPNLPPPPPPPAGPTIGTTSPAAPATAPQGEQPMAQPRNESSESDLSTETNPPERKGRDPFWPVGYVPRKPVPTTAAKAATPVPESTPDLGLPDWDGARKRMDSRGISRIGRDRDGGQDKYLAVINGKVVEAGDIVTVPFEGRIYRWRIQAIGPQGIALTRLDIRPQ
jgi:hypothetical protein